MLINISDSLLNEGKTQEFTVPVDLKSIKVFGDGFILSDSEDVEIKVSNVGNGKARVCGKGSASFETVCDRCLAPITTVVKFEFERFAVSPDNPTDEDEDEDLIELQGFSIDMDDLVKSEILISWPMKILCKEDCKGTCPVCGQNLNEGECGCDTFVPDPRMAVIQDIFNANKEV